MLSKNQQQLDDQYMTEALALASQSALLNEVPVGAVLVLEGKIVGRGTNRCLTDHDPSAHAEVIALRKAAAGKQDYRLDGATLYVTLEPCLMCCGALLQARVSRLVFGAREPRTGAVVSVHDSLRAPGVDHHVAITEGVRSADSAEMLQTFFNRLRKL